MDILSKKMKAQVLIGLFNASVALMSPVVKTMCNYCVDLH